MDYNYKDNQIFKSNALKMVRSHKKNLDTSRVSISDAQANQREKMQRRRIAPGAKAKYAKNERDRYAILDIEKKQKRKQ